MGPTWESWQWHIQGLSWEIWDEALRDVGGSHTVEKDGKQNLEFNSIGKRDKGGFLIRSVMWSALLLLPDNPAGRAKSRQAWGHQMAKSKIPEEAVGEVPDTSSSALELMPSFSNRCYSCFLWNSLHALPIATGTFCSTEMRIQLCSKMEEMTYGTIFNIL